MAEKQAVHELDESSTDPGSASVDDSSTRKILESLADLKEKERQMKVERDEIDQKLRESNQEIDEMKRDVEILKNLEPSQYRQVEERMEEDEHARQL